MELTWYGTAAIKLKTQQSSLLFDPFVPLRGSCVNINAENFDGVRHIVITHAHMDHIASLPALFQREPRDIYGTDAVLAALADLGLPKECLHRIAPGDTFTLGAVSLHAFQGRHVRYDAVTLLGTLFSPRMLKYRHNLPQLGRDNRICRENGETVAYQIEADGKQVFLLGSLNLDPDTEYPTCADLLVLPYQGTSDLRTPAEAIIARLQPKAVLLDHFDDTFPPISRNIDTAELRTAFLGRLPVYKVKQGETLTV